MDTNTIAQRLFFYSTPTEQLSSDGKISIFVVPNVREVVECLPFRRLVLL